MLSVHSSPSSPFIRKSPGVLALQTSSPYRDYFTDSKFWAELNQTISHAHPENPGLSQSPQRSSPPACVRTPSQWTGSSRNGHGLRHRNDESPFNLWDPLKRTYRSLTKEEIAWIGQRYNAISVGTHAGKLYVRTDNPPRPVTCTIGGQAVFFLARDVPLPSFVADSGYGNPKMPDPYRGEKWGTYDTPSRSCMIAVNEALASQMSIQKIMFFIGFTVVELTYGDGRTYARASLPAMVAGIPTSYHHKATSFMGEMRSLTMARFVDPQPPGAPLTQDLTNYLQPQHGGSLTPGVRVSTTTILTQMGSGGVSMGSTLGVGLQKHGMKCVTVSNHSFRILTRMNGMNLDRTDGQVWHPESPASQGRGIGTVVDRYLDLDIALVKLSDGVPFTNNVYFMARPPRFLQRYNNVSGFYEVDGMSTGLITLLLEAKEIGVAGGPGEYKFRDYYRLLSETNKVMAASMCGAPIVDAVTGGVSGFFHLASPDNNFAVTEALDQLIDDGWSVIL